MLVESGPMRSNICIECNSPLASASSSASSEFVCMNFPSRCCSRIRLRLSRRDEEGERFDSWPCSRRYCASALSDFFCWSTVRCLMGSPSSLRVGGSGAGSSTISLLLILGLLPSRSMGMGCRRVVLPQSVCVTVRAAAAGQRHSGDAIAARNRPATPSACAPAQPCCPS